MRNYKDAGVTGVNAANLTATNTAIAAKDAADTDTTAEVQAIVSATNAPSATSTIDDKSNIDVRSPIVLTFTDAVEIGNYGNIVLTDTNGSGATAGHSWRLDTSVNTQTIAVTQANVNSGLITFSADKKTVTINPQYDLDFSTHYRVTAAKGVFKNAGGTDALDIDIEFDTVTPAFNELGTQSKIQVAGTDSLVASNWWVDAHQSVLKATAVEVDASSKDIAAAISFNALGQVEKSGFINLNGVTNLQDIIYSDDSVISDGIMSAYDKWDGHLKLTSAISGISGVGVRLVETSYKYTDKDVMDAGAATILYG